MEKIRPSLVLITCFLILLCVIVGIAAYTYTSQFLLLFVLFVVLVYLLSVQARQRIHAYKSRGCCYGRGSRLHAAYDLSLIILYFFVMPLMGVLLSVLLFI